MIVLRNSAALAQFLIDLSILKQYKEIQKKNNSNISETWLPNRQCAELTMCCETANDTAYSRVHSNSYYIQMSLLIAQN